MNNHKKETIIIIVSLIVFLTFAILAIYLYSKNNSENSYISNETIATTTEPIASSTIVYKYDDFAKCLTGKGILMYGAIWCENCKIQKNLFGSSFQYIKYVECPDNAKLCLEKGIEGYPTWIFADGKKIEGRDTLEDLAKVSGCELPK
ncbi:MAG: hypothetical protein WCC74_02620 [Minisyncoccia bacterium]